MHIRMFAAPTILLLTLHTLLTVTLAAPLPQYGFLDPGINIVEHELNGEFWQAFDFLRQVLAAARGS